MISKRFQVDEENSNDRIDIFLANNLDAISRGIVQQLISEGNVTVNGKATKRNYLLKAADVIEVTFELKANCKDDAQDIPIDITFENEDFFVINKDSGLTVHPGAGQKDNTLINGILHIRKEQRDIPRYGLVHRLDKDTSGLMLIAKNLKAHTILTELIQVKKIQRHYYALVHGVPISGQTIDLPIGRHTKNRLLYCVKDGGRDATTHFRIKKKFKNFSLLHVELETGRTHQIRVHLKHIGHPIAGDKSYNKIKAWKDAIPKELEAINKLKRQALHSYKLKFHFLNEGFVFESKLPNDIEKTLEGLEE